LIEDNLKLVIAHSSSSVFLSSVLRTKSCYCYDVTWSYFCFLLIFPC
jgi:hypothetical protein